MGLMPPPQINNAGIFDMGTKARNVTADGYESHFGTNYIVRRRFSQRVFPVLHVTAPAPDYEAPLHFLE